MRRVQESRQKAVFDERIDTTHQSLDRLSTLDAQLDKDKSAIDQARLQPSKSAVEATSKLLLPKAINADAIARSNKYRAEAELSTKSARTLAGVIFKLTNPAHFESMALSYFTSLTVLNRLQQYIAMSQSHSLSGINSNDRFKLNQPNEQNNSVKEDIEKLKGLLDTIHQETRDKCVKRFDIVERKNIASAEEDKKKLSKIVTDEKNQQKESKIFSKDEEDFLNLIETYSKKVMIGIDKKVDDLLNKGDHLSAVRLLQSLHQSVSEIQQNLPNSFIDIKAIVTQDKVDRNTVSRYVYDMNSHLSYIKGIMDKDPVLLEVLEHCDPKNKGKDKPTMEALDRKIKSLDESINHTDDQNEKDRLTTLKTAFKEYKTLFVNAINLRDKEEWVKGQEHIDTRGVLRSDIDNEKYFSGIFDINNKNSTETLSSPQHQIPIGQIFAQGATDMEKESKTPINPETLDYLMTNHEKEMTDIIQPTLKAHFENKLMEATKNELDKSMPLLKSVSRDLTEALKKLDREGDLTQLSDDHLKEIVAQVKKNKSSTDSTVVNAILDNNGVNILRNAINKFDEKKGNVDTGIFSDLEKTWNAFKNIENERKLDDLLGGKNTIQDLTDTERTLVGAKVSERIIQNSELTINQERTTISQEGKKISKIGLDARFRLAQCRNIAAKSDLLLQTLRGNTPKNQNIEQQQVSSTVQPKHADSPSQHATASSPPPTVPPIPKNFIPKWAKKSNEGKQVTLVTPGKPEATRKFTVGQSWTQKSAQLQNPPAPVEAPKHEPKK